MTHTHRGMRQAAAAALAIIAGSCLANSPAGSCAPAQLCIVGCAQPCAQQAPKPKPRPCPFTPAGSINAMTQIPETARVLILDAVNAGALSARVSVAGGRMIMDTGQELVKPLDAQGQPIAPPANGIGRVYRWAGHYVVRWDNGCHPLAMVTNPADLPSAYRQPPTPPLRPALPAVLPDVAGPAIPAPEPGSIWLVLAALAALVVIAWRGRS